MDFCWQSNVSAFFNTIFMFVIAFLASSNHLLISWLQSPCTLIFEAQENKICHSFNSFPFCLPWSDGSRCLDLSFFFHFEFKTNFLTLHFYPPTDHILLEHGPLEKWRKPLQDSCLKNSMKSMKRQKDMILEHEPPRSVGVQYATGEKWRNSSRENEETEPKWKWCQP